MKKNYCLWILLSCNVFLAQAQLVKVERSYKINKETPGFYPVFSNDGKELLYTSENYKGLFLYDLKSKTSDVITEVEVQDIIRPLTGMANKFTIGPRRK